jgi:hypothetical protein
MAAAVFACAPAPPGGDAGPEPTVDTGLRINEVMSRNDGVLQDEAAEFDDWIEIFNAGDEAVDLEGFALSDDDANPAAFLFDARALQPGEYLLVFADGQPAQGALHASFRLAGGGETLTLRDPSGAIADRVDFPELAVDQSAGRSPNGEGDFVALIDPTPRAANSAPVARDDVPAAEGVVINELLALNETGLVDSAGQFEDWVELFNTSSEAQDISFHHLSDSADAPFLYTFPEDTFIEPGGFHIVFLDGEPLQGGDHAGFGLSGAGDSIRFNAPDGAALDSHTFDAQTVDVSLARVPDGTGDFVAQSPTPEAPNS